VTNLAHAERKYVYDLSDSERDELTQHFLSSKGTPACHGFACFELEGTDPYANIARQVEREVFEDSWGNDSVTMKQEYGPYDESSVFFLAIDTQAKRPAGVLRMIRNSPAGLKTIVDLDDSIKSPIAPIAIPADEVMRHHGIEDLDRCWDGATAAVPRQYRGKLAAMHVQLMQVVAAAAMRENIQHFVAVLDAPVVKAARSSPRRSSSTRPTCSNSSCRYSAEAETRLPHDVGERFACGVNAAAVASWQGRVRRVLASADPVGDGPAAQVGGRRRRTVGRDSRRTTVLPARNW
jgi:hypothetical protein